MDALMRARNIAAQRAQAGAEGHVAQAHAPSTAFADRSGAHTTPHPEPIAARGQRSPPPNASP
eukprot:2897995-Pleurochrysis_carterae.AAC.1